MLSQITEDNEKYKSMIEKIREDRGFTSASPKQKSGKVNQEELERLEQAKQTIEQKIKEQEKQHRKDLKQWDRSIKEKEQTYTEMQKELKEREQENRISKLKIKEMKRLIKHNQLKPLSQMTPSENDTISTVKKGSTSPEKKKKDKNEKPKPPQWSL